MVTKGRGILLHTAENRDNGYFDLIVLFKIDSCVWYQCINPPIPNGHRLKPDWKGVPYEIGESAIYTCETTGLWFETDRDQESLKVECLSNGTFQVPDQWPYCVASK